MCGIAGLLTREAFSIEDGQELAKRLGASILHRGPDGHGAHVADGIVALNCRLAIVDIAGGEQPIYSKGCNVGIVFDGEIYNYLSLCEGLRTAGCSFKTHANTEVILALYLVYGVAAFEKLNGMFAFCLWDDRSGERFICRDRFGMKPLYYSYEPYTAPSRVARVGRADPHRRRASRGAV